MRPKILIALAFLLLALFAISACAIDNELTTEYGFSADQLMDASNGVYPSSGPTESPKDARMRWSKTSEEDYTKPAESSTTSTMPTEPSQEVAAPSAAGATGNWSFILKDSMDRSIAVTLFQAESTLFGTGTLNEGNETQIVSASGSRNGDKINLSVTSLATSNLYSLYLTKNENSASGEYRAFSSSGESWVGTVVGILTPSQN